MVAEWPIKDAHAVIPGSYEYVMLHVKRDFADLLKVVDLKLEQPSLVSLQ